MSFETLSDRRPTPSTSVIATTNASTNVHAETDTRAGSDGTYPHATVLEAGGSA